jgi:hypothetical protein
VGLFLQFMRASHQLREGISPNHMGERGRAAMGSSRSQNENPLFSNTWWVRLCNFTCHVMLLETPTAPLSGAATS